MNTTQDGLCTGFALVPGDKNYFESNALDQLAQAASREGVCKVVGYPDLHPGKGIAVGAAVVSLGHLYPFFIGGDIGCGMGLWRTSMKRRKAKLDRIAEKLDRGMSRSFDHDTEEVAYPEVMGTLGGGNHFAELQTVEHIFDPTLAEQYAVDSQYVHILVHSGSRTYGERILRNHTSEFGPRGLTAETLETREYLNEHDEACEWAKRNREQICARISSALGVSKQLISDVSHNSLSRKQVGVSEYWIHRKGAAAADQGPVVVAGTRGSFSYLVEPVDACSEYAWSLSHGAGRKWQRSECKGRLRDYLRKPGLLQTPLGSRVLCADKDLLYEEAPQAYKDIDTVIGHLLEAKMIRLIASFRPLVTYKSCAKPRRKRKAAR